MACFELAHAPTPGDVCGGAFVSGLHPENFTPTYLNAWLERQSRSRRPTGQNRIARIPGKKNEFGLLANENYNVGDLVAVYVVEEMLNGSHAPITGACFFRRGSRLYINHECISFHRHTFYFNSLLTVFFFILIFSLLLSLFLNFLSFCFSFSFSSPSALLSFLFFFPVASSIPGGTYSVASLNKDGRSKSKTKTGYFTGDCLTYRGEICEVLMYDHE
jgi:hypothetical protein